MFFLKNIPPAQCLFSEFNKTKIRVTFILLLIFQDGHLLNWRIELSKQFHNAFVLFCMYNVF